MSSQREEIKKAWGIFDVVPDSVLEIRAIWPKTIAEDRGSRTSHFRAGDYLSLDEFKAAVEKHAIHLNEQGFNIYVVMTRIDPNFECGRAATDKDVIARTLLLVDIDRTGSPKCPASDSELEEAKALADRIRTYLRGKSWPEPTVVMSGNGYHLYYPLANLPNTKETNALCSQTLIHLAQKFDNAAVGVDPVVFNASRITKLPGTIMRKGMETEDRPYRVAVVCDEA